MKGGWKKNQSAENHDKRKQAYVKQQPGQRVENDDHDISPDSCFFYHQKIGNGQIIKSSHPAKSKSHPFELKPITKQW